jgi:hypothetical protein
VFEFRDALTSAEADVGHASGKVRSGEQITRHGAALSAYRGNEPADQIGGYFAWVGCLERRSSAGSGNGVSSMMRS